MQTPPQLFDPTALALRRQRAARIGAVDFLHRAVASEIKERLNEVNRSFTAPALVGGMPVWQGLDLPDLVAVPEAEVLPLAPGAHDLIIHALSLHWANDPVGQMVQVRNALKPDGLFLAAFFGGQTLHELRVSLAEAEAAITGGLSPRVAPMGELRALGGLLQRAGLALPVADSAVITTSYASPLHLMRELRAMGETNVMTARRKVPLRRDVLARACEIYASNFATPDGRVTATFEVVYLTGWKPSADQPKPLRPGSAKMRLADALGTAERPLDDKAGR